MPRSYPSRTALEILNNMQCVTQIRNFVKNRPLQLLKKTKVAYDFVGMDGICEKRCYWLNSFENQRRILVMVAKLVANFFD